MIKIVKGNIILRSGIDREDYIKACYSTNTVDILTEDGGQISIKYPFNVFHGRNDGIICDLYFPHQPQELLGSTVYALIDNGNNVAILTADETKGYTLYEEDLIRIMKTAGENGNNSNSAIDIRGKVGELLFNVCSNIPNGGNIRFVTENSNSNSEFSILTDLLTIFAKSSILNVSNSFELNVINGEKKTNISYVLGTGFVLKDEFGNEIKQTENELVLSHLKKVLIGSEASEPLILGNVFKTVFKDYFNEMNSLLVEYITENSTLVSAMVYSSFSTPSPSAPNIVALIPKYTTKMQTLTTKYISKIDTYLSAYSFTK